MIKESMVLKSGGNRSILVYLSEQDISYVSEISKEIKLTTAGIKRNILTLEKMGFVKRYDYNERRNRKKIDSLKKYYKITDKGRKVGELLIEISLIK